MGSEFKLLIRVQISVCETFSNLFRILSVRTWLGNHSVNYLGFPGLRLRLNWAQDLAINAVGQAGYHETIYARVLFEALLMDTYNIHAVKPVLSITQK